MKSRPRTIVISVRLLFDAIDWRAVLIASAGHDSRRPNCIPLPGAVPDAHEIKLAEVFRWVRSASAERQQGL
jgi:hypothetical protein